MEFTATLMTTSCIFPLSPTPPFLHLPSPAVKDIKTWTSKNFPKLNGNKSEVLLTGPKSTLAKAPPFTISINDCLVQISSQVKSLGVILDSTLSLIPQISNISCTALFHLWNIARLSARPPLSTAPKFSFIP
ncbi:hypothetical protein LDENG_00130330 [Lucifuga dentata]|nr:hypothetical protein LDENG_00130330 [Lucifuga dentata]